MLLIIGALAIGLTLGLLGSGGSILTVPVLVYLLGHADKVAIAESLAIVGAISLVGVFPYARKRQVNWRSVILFGIPGMGGAYLGAWLSVFVSGALQLVLFSLVMLLAAGMMLRRAPAGLSEETAGTHAPHPWWQIVLEGIIVGIVTGLVGVGGGFLIVPALVILGGLPMRQAVGTSLLIIALKSLSGFVKYQAVLASLGTAVNWQVIGVFVAVGIVGIVIGSQLSQRLEQQTLKRGFAVFLVIMGLFVLGQEFPKVLTPTNTVTAMILPATSASDSLFELQSHGPGNLFSQKVIESVVVRGR